MAKGLALFVGAKATQTAHFVDMFNKFFDTMNGSSLSAGKRSRNPFRSPYRSENDWKLKVCITVYHLQSFHKHFILLVVDRGIPALP